MEVPFIASIYLPGLSLWFGCRAVYYLFTNLANQYRGGVDSATRAYRAYNKRRSMIAKGVPSSIRALNRRIVLNHIRRHGPTSRAQLCGVMGLSSAAMSAITAELIEDHLLKEHGFGEASSSGGRRPVLLEIDYSSHWAIGMNISDSHIDAVLTDMSVQVLEYIQEPLENPAPLEVAKQVAAICKKLLKTTKPKPKRVVGIGIGVPGVVDAVNGIANHSLYLEWHNAPFAQIVHDQTSLPVWIDNEIRTFGAAERLFGHGLHSPNFLLIAIGRGVGCAMVINGDVYRGSQGGAGEFGHNIVVPGGRVCHCGQRGCLSAYVSIVSMVEQFLELHPRHKKISYEGLVKLEEEGNPSAKQVLSEIGSLLGTHVSYMINAFNPERIIFRELNTPLGSTFYKAMHTTIKELTFNGLANNLSLVEIPFYQNDYSFWARGAASLVVQSAFNEQNAFDLLPGRP